MQTKTKILTLDIETSPLTAYSWGPKWETNLIEVLEESYILSYSAKWLGGKHITKGWPDYKGYRKGVKDDQAIVQDLHNLFEEAEIIIVQNGKAFDVKTINSRFIANQFAPPSPYKVVDTKTEAKKYLRLPSYSLDSMCEYFGLGKKQEHEGFPLWKKCMAGDLKAWKRMLKYNKHDVELTEQLYLKLRPFMNTHPNLGVYTDRPVCPKCGGGVELRGFYFTSTSKYQRFVCKDCGGWSRALKSEKKKVYANI